MSIAIFDPPKLKKIKLSLRAYNAVSCQEASSLSRETYIPCGQHVTALIENKDSHLYFMCAACASHNLHNRGAKQIAEIEIGEFGR